ncbi:hemerythrin domain-containing protein [Thermocrinis minervae]|uniref:Hemerythrin n=1 Tax=Thermocrinis minervae TaxID=381751 RepID=A0A1M6SN57_9AQUI|nr:hemerythrin domain-containing protein [Thermocrinis minervae]SHK46143.1 hemerythrin [Thermocrinis minervae]
MLEFPKVANAIMNALHEDEVEIIEELLQACKEGSVNRVDQLMDELFQDMEIHFSTEEEMMREFEFFAYPMHKAEHDSMRKEFKEFYTTWKENKDVGRVESFLKDRFIPWLLLHIARWDSTTAMHLGD